jgi:phosphopantothenate synthetase
MCEVDTVSPITEPAKSTSPAAVAAADIAADPIISVTHDNSVLKPADTIVVPATSVFRSVTTFILLLMLEEPTEAVLTEISTKVEQLVTEDPATLETTA